MNVGAMIRAMAAAGCSIEQIADSFERMDEQRKAKGREGNRRRQAEHRARRNESNANNASNANNGVTPVTCVTEPPASRACSNTNLPSEDISNTYPSDRTGKPVQTPQARLWSQGVPAVIALGVPERQARGVIGGWLKNSTPETVLDAIAAASRECPIDPIPWITAALRPASRAGPPRSKPSATSAILDLIAEERVS
jgi:hypothetical protein